MEEQRDIISLLDAEKWGGDAQLIDLLIVDDEIVGTVPIVRLEMNNPLVNSPWFDGPDVSQQGVEQAIREGRFEALPYPGFSFSGNSSWNNRRHEERIAYLTVNPDHRPISIEFIDREQESLEIYDGWHRLAAAHMRGDVEINIAVGGWFRHSVSRLGAICRQYCKLGTPEAAEAFWLGDPDSASNFSLGG